MKTDQTAETLPYAHGGGTMTQTTDRDQKTEEQERPEETLRRLAARARHLITTTKDCHHTKGVEFFLEEVAALTTGSAE